MIFKQTIQWENESGIIIFKFPEQGIKNNTELVVLENQEAVFFIDGRAINSFGPGSHQLSNVNKVPLKDSSGETVTEESIMNADVYFINKSEIPNLKWGTKHPVNIIDPVYKIAVPVRGFGNYSIRVKDSKSLLMMAIGTWNAFKFNEIGDVLRDQIILPKLQDLISETIIDKQLSILNISTYIDELSISVKIKIAEDFESFGIELVRFSIESINFPPDDESVKRLKRALAVKSEIGIMGEEDYKLSRAMDTLEKAAEHNGSEAGKILPGILKSNKNSGIKCPECSSINNEDAKFCSYCGKELKLSRSCPSCGKKIKSGIKYCPECGANLQERICPKCKTIIKPGAKFCHECGRQVS